MILKDSVRLGDLKPQLVLGLVVAESVYQMHRIPLVVTSCNDSTHGGSPVAGEAKDPHYTGRAADLRLNSIPDWNTRVLIVKELVGALGPMFLVLHESAGTPNEHCHIQYQGAP